MTYPKNAFQSEKQYIITIRIKTNGYFHNDDTTKQMKPSRPTKLAFSTGLSIFLLTLYAESAHSQKIVFSDNYALKNNAASSKMPKSKILIDDETQDKMLIVSGMKNLTCYLFNKDWNLIEKFEHDFAKKSVLADNDFQVLKYT